jgi:hypothetical protein
MAWVRMLQTHRYTLPEDRRVTIKYLEGNRYLVKRNACETMKKLKVAREIRAPRREPTR